MTQDLQQVVVLVIFNVLFDKIKYWQPYVDPQNSFWKFYQGIKSKCLGAAELKD